VLLGRRYGVDVAANEYFAELAQEMLRRGAAPGTASWEKAEAYLFSSRR
jgi:hypothetical protein